MATYEQSTSSTPTSQTSDITGWVGWIYFGGLMMIILGAMNALYGLVAVANDEWVVWGNRAVVYLDVTQWGWVHLVAGVIVVLAGIGVLTGSAVGRVIGAMVVALSMLVNFLAIPVYPVWSIVVLALEAFVLYALVAHGGELERR